MGKARQSFDLIHSPQVRSPQSLVHAPASPCITFTSHHTAAMSPARLPPPVVIPPSQNTVDVYIIDTTSYMSNVPAEAFVDPLVPGFETLNAGSYAFLLRLHKLWPSLEKPTRIFIGEYRPEALQLLKDGAVRKAHLDSGDHLDCGH